MLGRRRTVGLILVGTLALAAAACGSDDNNSGGASGGTSAPSGSTGGGGGGGGASGAGITLAVNPWTGSAVNANVAKVVLESKLNTPVNLIDIDEFATWPGMDEGTIDGVLEVWPSGHQADITTYIDQKKSVENIGLIGPTGKIGWYVPTKTVDEHPELATWEGFKNEADAKLFATAESGDLGQFLMGDPSYVSYDEDIIKNLNLPLKFVVAGSETALITAIEQADKDDTPLLAQFWTPHWLHAKVDLTEVKLPDVTDACLASAAAKDGKYACDYPPDPLFKAVSVKLKDKNQAAFDFLSKIQFTAEQQNEIGSWISADGMDPLAAAQKWVDENPDVVNSWLS
jgi:glycine betaine/proline transport system substrate-binding protein